VTGSPLSTASSAQCGSRFEPDLRHDPRLDRAKTVDAHRDVLLQGHDRHGEGTFDEEKVASCAESDQDGRSEQTLAHPAGHALPSCAADTEQFELLDEQPRPFRPAPKARFPSDQRIARPCTSEIRRTAQSSGSMSSAHGPAARARASSAASMPWKRIINSEVLTQVGVLCLQFPRMQDCRDRGIGLDQLQLNADQAISRCSGSAFREFSSTPRSSFRLAPRPRRATGPVWWGNVEDRSLRQTDRVGDRLRGQPVGPKLIRQPQSCGGDLCLR
jgi:hypothetical protein